MPYSISWFTLGKVLYVELSGSVRIEELTEMNQAITDILNKQHGNLNIMFNVSDLSSAYQTPDDLRETQKYMNHYRVKTAYFVSPNKLHRLIVIVAFGLSQAIIVQFNTMQEAADTLKEQGFQSSLPLAPDGYVMK